MVSMRNSEVDEEPYALSVMAYGRSICVETAGTKYIGHADGLHEVRKATPFCGTDFWGLLGERWVRVESRSDLLSFLMLGGHGLVAQKLIADWWPDFFSPVRCFRYSGGSPFISRGHLPPGAQQRHPPPFVRKQVLARDDYRCRSCGYSPDDHLAIKLDIHHIFEHSLGGLTIETNLLTLCKACHDNAARPDAWLRGDMFDKIFVGATRFHRRQHAEGVEAYRIWAARALKEPSLGGKICDPLEPLIFDADDPHDYKRSSQWSLAYMLLADNSVSRYFSFNEWRRILPAELRSK